MILRGFEVERLTHSVTRLAFISIFKRKTNLYQTFATDRYSIDADLLLRLPPRMRQRDPTRSPIKHNVIRPTYRILAGDQNPKRQS